jgi:hypothetical protein
MTDAEHWARLQTLAKRVGTEFPDAVFIGGLAVFVHAERLGSRWQEGSHDVDCYLSLIDKDAMRDRYEIRHSPHLHKDSARIEDEDFDVYTEHQHRLAVPYDAVATHSLKTSDLRVASLEHLTVLKADAALGRSGSAKGEKDQRDLARILTLMTEPREQLISHYLTPQRREMLERVAERADLLVKMGLNAHEASRRRKQLVNTVKTLISSSEGGDRARTP